MFIGTACNIVKNTVWQSLKNSLKKFIKDNQIQLEIEAAADLLFAEFDGNGFYQYIEDIRENELDQIIAYVLNSSNINMKAKIDELFSNEKCGKIKKDVVLAFSNKLSDIIIDIQLKHVDENSKIVIKANEKNIKSSEERIMSQIKDIKSNINSHKENEYSNLKECNKIGILSIESSKIDSRITKLEELKERTLNLVCDFKDFYLKHKFIDWNKIQIKINKFIESQLTEMDEYVLIISANYSVVYAFGKLLGLKSPNVTLLNGTKVMNIQTAKIIDINIQENKELNAQSDILNVILSIGMEDIEKQVKDMYNNPVVNWMSVYYNQYINTNNEFWSLVKIVNNTISELVRSEKIRLINLYYKGPAELLFAIGQLSNNWCECQIKEYNFKEKDKEKNIYFDGIKI